MGYFANGTEGEAYEARWCNRCVHQRGERDTGCAVWNAHLLTNYSQTEGSALETALSVLIPRRGIENLKCLMFLTGEDVRRARLARSRKPLLESAACGDSAG